jgi:hypothetical protein
MKAEPGLIGQAGDPLGPQYRRELAQHAWQAPGRHHRHTIHDDLAPGDLGAMDRHHRHHHHVGVGQDLGGLVGLERHSAQCGGEGIAAMPEPPGPVELKAAPILLGVDHEHPTRPDHQMIDVGPATRDGQVVQDRPTVPLQLIEQLLRGRTAKAFSCCPPVWLDMGRL